MCFAVDKRYPPRACLALTLILVFLSGQYAAASSWDAELGTGQQISVSPSDHRAVIQSGVGQGKPLWDGVHRLSDGSTITIRSGILVPNEAVQTYQPAPVPPPAAAADDNAMPVPPPPTGSRGRCDELVLWSCGLHGSCGDTEPCVLARQLRQAQHQPDAVRLGNANWAEQQCREALQDSARFPACDHEPPLEVNACRYLLDRVCAGGPRCVHSPSCQTAEELFELELTALENGAEAELEVIRPRCLEILSNHAFFPPCR